MGSWPPAVRAQLEELQRGLLDLLGEGLVGIYLHGSLAMDCFNTERSDLGLNSCRVVVYLEENRITSKAEAGGVGREPRS